LFSNDPPDVSSGRAGEQSVQEEAVKPSKPRAAIIPRRALLQAAAGGAVATGLASLWGSHAPAADSRQGTVALFRELDAKIEAAMARYHIPGVAVGVIYQDHEYLRGYGVTNIDYPLPVDGDTLFRIGSTTKTFTGTAAMRLAEQGVLDLNAPVRTYLPALKLMDESVAT
jgi:CubicO group peptidase (beta-lactamase class C family)